MKKGDILFCKKDFHYSANINDNWLKRKLTDSLLFKKGKFYEVMHVEKYLIVIETELERQFNLHKNKIKMYFLTKSNIRKLKLSKIKKITKNEN